MLLDEKKQNESYGNTEFSENYIEREFGIKLSELNHTTFNLSYIRTFFFFLSHDFLYKSEFVWHSFLQIVAGKHSHINIKP